MDSTTEKRRAHYQSTRRRATHGWACTLAVEISCNTLRARGKRGESKMMYEVYNSSLPGYSSRKDGDLLRKFRKRGEAVQFAQKKVDELLRFEYRQRPMISPTELYTRFLNFSCVTFVTGTTFDARSYARTRSFDIVEEMLEAVVQR